MVYLSIGWLNYCVCGGNVMPQKASGISQETAHVVKKVENGEISPQHGLESLLKIALSCGTVHDLEYVGKARESIEQYEKMLAD
jgi:hypothetical protein